MPLTPIQAPKIKGHPVYWLPDTLEDPFRFILEEQGTWYDPALNAYLNWLEHGHRILDIGSDPGIYAIPAAQQIGPTGRLESIRLSNSGQQGLSKAGESMHWISSRLGDLKSDPTFIDVDVIRIGSAAITPEGGWLMSHPEILASRPWLYVSTRSNDTWDMAHFDRLLSSGYVLGRYLPFLNALVPYDWTFLTTREPYCAHLFAIPQERMNSWSAQGRWTEPAPLHYVPSPIAMEQQVNNWAPPYRSAIESHIIQDYPDHDLEQLALGLAIHALTPNPDNSLEARLSDWQWSVQLLALLIEKQPTVSRLLTLARLRFEAGERTLALQHLETAHGYFETGNTILSALFLSPDSVWDNLPPNNDVATWLYAAVLDTWTRQRHLSAYTLDAQGESAWKYLEANKILPEDSCHAWTLHQKRYANTQAPRL